MLLKRAIRSLLNAAIQDDHLRDEQILGVLMSLNAELIAEVPDDGIRGEFVDIVVSQFPDAVMFARAMSGEGTWQ